MSGWQGPGSGLSKCTHVHVCVCMCVHICVLFTQGLCLCTQGTHACTPGVKGMLFVQVCVSVCVCERMPVCGEPRGPLEGPGPSSQGMRVISGS